MAQAMTITLEIHEDGAAFRHPEGYGGIVEEMDDLLERRDTGRIDAGGYLVGLLDFVARHPDFIDGHAHLGLALYRQRKTRRALDACLRGLALGEAAIPPGYRGAIEWGCLENRPFLRAAHGAVFCYLRMRQRRKALALMERMLVWNPEDNQGVRYILGSEYLRVGEADKAIAVFEAECPYYPPYRYELALSFLRRGEHAAAATSLRHGFVENDYIAEILCGMANPLPVAMWHASNLAGPELAEEYVSQYGDLWRLTRGAVAFLRWLHTHPKVMAERASVLEYKEALLWEDDIERRRAILDKEEAAAKGIDGRLSEEIIKDQRDCHGRTVSPWLYPTTLSKSEL
jgi:tetratricopeptide (TPR) repeat protein